MSRLRVILCLILAAATFLPCQVAVIRLLDDGALAMDVQPRDQEDETDNLPIDEAPNGEEPDIETDDALQANGLQRVHCTGEYACELQTTLAAQGDGSAHVPPPRFS
jgi:hypothetical protein